MIRNAAFSLLAAALLAGCGSDTPASPPSDPSGKAPALASAAGARPAAFAQCTTCHAVEPGKNGIGPSLAGVYGAQAGHEGAFAYSSAMRGSGIVWDEGELDAYLANPMAKVPGTKMSFGGVKDPGQRSEIIAYLKTL